MTLRATLALTTAAFVALATSARAADGVPAIEGWVGFGNTETAYWYLRPAPRGDEYPRVWVRTEFKAGHTLVGKYRSATDLSELDCKQHRLRSISAVVYPRNNLGGDPVMATRDAAWEYGPPGSIKDDTITIVCGSVLADE